MDVFLQAAIEEAKKGLAEGGIPIGSVLVLDGKIIGRGHNQRVQHGSVIHHAEMNCLENAGSIRFKVKRDRVIPVCKLLLDDLAVSDIDIQEVPIEDVIRQIFAR